MLVDVRYAVRQLKYALLTHGGSCETVARMMGDCCQRALDALERVQASLETARERLDVAYGLSCNPDVVDAIQDAIYAVGGSLDAIEAGREETI